MSAAMAACYKDVCAFIDKSLSRRGTHLVVPTETTATLPGNLLTTLRLSYGPL
jgi:hypothetical protein